MRPQQNPSLDGRVLPYNSNNDGNVPLGNQDVADTVTAMTKQTKTTAATLAVVGCICYILLWGCSANSATPPATEVATTTTTATTATTTTTTVAAEPADRTGDVGDTRQVDGFTVAVAAADIPDLRTITWNVNVRNETQQPLHVTDHMWTTTGPDGQTPTSAAPEDILLQPGQVINGTVTALRGEWDIPAELWGIPGSARRDDPEHVALFEAVAATDGTYYITFTAGNESAVWAVEVATSVS